MCTYIHTHTKSHSLLFMCSYRTYWLSPTAVNIGVVLEGCSIWRHPHQNIQVALVIVDCCRLDYRGISTGFCVGVFEGGGWRECSLWSSRLS